MSEAVPRELAQALADPENARWLILSDPQSLPPEIGRLPNLKSLSVFAINRAGLTVPDTPAS